ncbi:MerC domain-containing protein [Halalkalibaculum sp. DA3122]|uniref:MerC domain-containing protein n=1 Tax=unclassified Halalkalibaculum TaxID=2964617 RepID=UPI0037545139
MKKEPSPALWDRLGISLSGICAVHCLFFPVAIALLPLWPAAEAIHDWTHPILFLLIVPTVIFALRGGVVDSRVPALLYAGLLVVGLAWLLHDPLGNFGEAAVTMAGSGLLVAGHWFNYRYHKNRCKTALDHETS